LQAALMHLNTCGLENRPYPNNLLGKLAKQKFDLSQPCSCCSNRSQKPARPPYSRHNTVEKTAVGIFENMVLKYATNI
jgi:hypothetical protein